MEKRIKKLRLSRESLRELTTLGQTAAGAAEAMTHGGWTCDTGCSTCTGCTGDTWCQCPTGPSCDGGCGGSAEACGSIDTMCYTYGYCCSITEPGGYTTC